MKRIAMIAIAVLLLAVGVANADRHWSIFNYINGDCNLEPYDQYDIEEMEQTGSDSNYIGIQIDGSVDYGGYDDDQGSNWTTARRYKLGYYPTTNNIIDQGGTGGGEFLADIGEVNMGDSATLKAFGIWAAKTFTRSATDPTEKNCLVLWDHGNGWMKKKLPPAHYKEAIFDDTGDALYAYNGELRAALKGTTDSLRQKLDIFGMDCCLMANMEWAYEVKPYANIYLASENVEPGDGWEYNTWLGGTGGMRTNPNMTADSLAKRQVTSYLNYYGSGDQPTMCAMDMNTQFERLLKAVDIFAFELIQAGGKDNTTINNARTSTQIFYGINEYRDLKDFARHIRAANINTDLNAAADSVLACFGNIPNNFIIKEGDEGYSDTVGGIWCYYPGPTANPDAAYQPLYFAKNNMWYPFINDKKAADLATITMVTYDHYRTNRTILPLDSFKYWVNDPSGDRDGIPDPGETVDFYLVLRNTGGQTATNVSATISTLQPRDITVIRPSANFPNITGSSKGKRATSYGVSLTSYSFSISNSAPVGEWVQFLLSITNTQEGTKTTSFPVQIGMKGEISGPFDSLQIYIQDAELDLTANPGEFVVSPTVFTRSLSIRLQIPDPRSPVDLRIYDTSGRIVKNFSVTNIYSTVPTVITWNGDDDLNRPVPAGIYFMRLEAGDLKKTEKAILLR